MIVSWNDPKHRLRVFIGGDNPKEVELLYSTLSSQLYEVSEYNQDTDVVDNILFRLEDPKDSGILYGPLSLLPIVERVIHTLGIPYESRAVRSESVEDEIGDLSDTLLEGIQLRDYQVESVKRALTHRSGIIKVCTGGGKTEIALAIIRYLYDTDSGNKMILCVPSTKLLYQTRERAIKRGFSPKDITLYGDGNSISPESRVMIATVQTLSRRLSSEEFLQWSEGLTLLIMDEAHHCSARTFYKVVDELAPKYLLGVTAEPYYGDKIHKVQDLLVRGLLGSVLYEVTVPMLVEKGYLSKPYLLVFNPPCERNIWRARDWKVIQKYGITENKSRNSMIVDIADSLIRVDKRPLILISLISHGKHLSAEISNRGYTVAMMTGGSKVDIYNNGMIIESMEDPDNKIVDLYTAGSIDVLIGTSVLDEGVDIPAISAVILAGGGKSPIKVVQRLGRSLRPKKVDNTTILIDFVDSFNPITLGHSKSRRNVISSLGVPQYFSNPSKDTFSTIIEFTDYFKSLQNSVQ